MKNQGGLEHSMGVHQGIPKNGKINGGWIGRPAGNDQGSSVDKYTGITPKNFAVNMLFLYY